MHHEPLIHRVEAYFAAVDSKDLEATMAFFTTDAVFTIATYNTVYTGLEEIAAMFERLFARYDRVWHGNFQHLVQLPDRIATRFNVENETFSQPVVHKNNCNFFHARDDRFDEVFVYMSGDNALR